MYLVGGSSPPLWKWWSKSVGMFWKSQHDGKVIKAMFQTTNQLYSPTINHYQPLLTRFIPYDYLAVLDQIFIWTTLHWAADIHPCALWLIVASTQLQGSKGIIVVGKAKYIIIHTWWFPKSWGYPQIIHLYSTVDGIFHYKPSSYWGTSILGHLHITI